MTPAQAALADILRNPTTRRLLDSAYEAGRDAAQAGTEDSANPHEPTSLFAVAWASGWFIAWRNTPPPGPCNGRLRRLITSRALFGASDQR